MLVRNRWFDVRGQRIEVVGRGQAPAGGTGIESILTNVGSCLRGGESGEQTLTGGGDVTRQRGEHRDFCATRLKRFMNL